MKRRIAQRLAQYTISVSSEVVRQEFKRRLLKEAAYLLNQLNRLGSLERVHRHVVDVLPQQQLRKRNICLELLSTIFQGRTDSDLTDRAKRYLRTLIKFGLNDFDESVGSVVRDVACACSRFPVIERRPYKQYDFGRDRCSQAAAACGVSSFLASRIALADAVLRHLKSLPAGSKTTELAGAEAFLERFLPNPGAVREADPCLTVGDLLIALESALIPSFYTLNSRESVHLCRSLGQSLVVRPKNPDHDDVVCGATQPDWQELLAHRGGSG